MASVIIVSSLFSIKSNDLQRDFTFSHYVIVPMCDAVTNELLLLMLPK
uniref:Uncharacterized protein n=1 Tax=Arundo donax TaxID=35708 RepID=A0A0A8Z1I2_ARUDO